MQTLILHVGTPKTGTTALQYYLAENRAALERQGVWHPPFFGVTRSRRHHWLIDGLWGEDQVDLEARMASIRAECPADIHTIVLSTEGIYRLWWEFPAFAREWLGSLKLRYDVKVWVWFREPVAFASAAYLQYLKGPPGVHPGLGRDISLEQMLGEEWFARQLDYIGFVRDARALFGEGAVRPFAYDGNTVSAFLSALDLPVLAEEPRRNPSMDARAASLVRAVNARNLGAEERASAIGIITALDSMRADPAPFKPSAAAFDRIGALSASSLKLLAVLQPRQHSRP